MANALYTKGKQNILHGNIDLGSDDIRVVLVGHRLDAQPVNP